MKRSKVWLAANGLLLAAFALAVVVQFNDPDPALWMVFYGLAAAACGLELAGRGGWLLPGLVALVGVAWAAIIAPEALVHETRLADLFTDARMMNAGVEEAREALGLLIVAAWMAALTFTGYRRVRRSKVDPSELSHSIR